MTVIDKRDYAQVVRASVVRCLEHSPHALDEIQAVVGFHIGASDEQVKYAVRVLRMDGAIGYDRDHGWYYATTTPKQEAK